MKTTRKLFYLFFGIVLISFFVSCTTSKGEIYTNIVTEEKKQATSDNASGNEGGETSNEKSSEEKGLKIITHPDDAEVYLNNIYQGKTPLLIENLDPGSYRLMIKRDGYYTKIVWIDYSKDLLVYETDLEQIVGYLSITTIPHDTEIRVGDSLLSEGIHQLPIGHYTITVRKFGYEEYSKEIEIRELETINLNIRLKEASFELSKLETSKEVFSPLNPGLLGEIEISFDVTSRGNGKIKIIDESGKTVFTEQIPQFKTWHQSFRWNGRDSKGKILPEGKYRIIVEGQSSKSGEKKVIERYVEIDNKVSITYRNVWNGNSGLLYSTTPEVLPLSSVQFSALSLGHMENVSGNLISRFPTAISLRAGLGLGFELDLFADFIAGNTGIVPLGGSLSLKKSLLEAGSTLSLSVGSYIKGSYQWGTKTDILSNYTGLTTGFPIEISAGSFKLFYSPEVIVSNDRVEYPGITPSFSVSPLYSWFYQRVGLMLDFGYLSTGISLVLRSSPVAHPDFTLIEYPLQTGFELNWLVPDTHLFISFALGAEGNSFDSYYVLAGGGLGLIY